MVCLSCCSRTSIVMDQTSSFWWTRWDSSHHRSRAFRLPGWRRSACVSTWASVTQRAEQGNRHQDGSEERRAGRNGRVSVLVDDDPGERPQYGCTVGQVALHRSRPASQDHGAGQESPDEQKDGAETRLTGASGCYQSPTYGLGGEAYGVGRRYPPEERPERPRDQPAPP